MINIKKINAAILYNGISSLAYQNNKREAMLAIILKIVINGEKIAFTPASISNLDAAIASNDMASDAIIRKARTGLRYLLIFVVWIILSLQIILPTNASATDFGTQGSSFKVIEEPFIQMMKNRMEKVDMEAEKEKIQKRAKHKVENPTPVKGIAPATKGRIFYFDPSYTLDKDVVLPCGKILHKAGATANPLEHIDLNRRMFFVDGKNHEQVEWLREQLKTPSPKIKNQIIEDRVILIRGSVFKLKDELGDDHGDKVYFDQAGELTTKFGIKASPAIVVQEGLALKIEEVEILR
jgi:conjugal transfer pilus assembly protein TraW